MLKDNQYLQIYRSVFNDFDKDFMVPCYSESKNLYRGSGYFSLQSLILSFEGLLKFIENDGHIDLVCSPELSETDVALIAAGEKLHDENAIKDVLEIINADNSFSEEELSKLDVICNMIADGRLCIKIAFMPEGMYHEKYGIFTDEDGNSVHFIGSANETVSAKVRNFESFTVHTSWTDIAQNSFINQELNLFNDVWNNRIENLTVIPFDIALQQQLFKKYKVSSTLSIAVESYLSKFNKGQKRLYDYQKKAIQEFIQNNYVHFYEMATGTGKTFTAIRTIRALEKRINDPLFVIICVPQIDLQVQWKRALEEDGYDGINLFGGVSQNTEMEISDAIINHSLGDKTICVSTYDTFFSKVYKQIGTIENVFLIVDEAHNLTPKQIDNLPKSIRHRLGLSATIQRFSEHETNKILDFFSPEPGKHKPFYYGLEDAINNKFLSHYNYYPIKVRLNEEEFERYQKKTLAIATEMNKKEEERDMDALNKLRTERSLIVKKAANKLERLREMTQEDYSFVNSVVYCGQGKDHEEPIIDGVTKVLYNAGLSVHTFTSKTEDRPKVLEEFEKGYFDTLVAIKCFDEGVDVPKLDKIYIMASDTALRQTVQRRGRVLRKCKETGKTIAHIFDMITFPPQGYYSEMGAKSLVVNELRRYKEYVRLADNIDDGNELLDKIYKTYGLSESDFENEDN